MLRFFAFAFAVLSSIAFATAQEPRTLTIYTYDAFAADYGPGPILKPAFEKICGCQLNFVAADSSIGALRRVQLEGTTTDADIILGLDTSLAGEARATGLFAPHTLALDKLNLAWADADFVPVDYGYFAFVYDKRKVPNPPASFEALIAMPESFKIVLEDPRSDTTGLGLVLWIKAAYGERAADIWKGLKPHIRTVTRGWSDAYYGIFLKGEADMVLSYTTSPAVHAVTENDPNYGATTFNQGAYPQIEIAGMLKTSSNQDLAKQFLAWLVTPEAQAIIPTTNWMYPVAPVGDALPSAFGDLPERVLSLDEAAITANKAAWIEEALAAIR
ncbi:MAG: thiamine ABC transporter substrate binding subunit [Devosia sp.]